jgi:hypothetical protein
MAISRRTKSRLQIVVIGAGIGAVDGIAISWLLSQILDFPYDVALFELGARSGLTVGGALATLALFYVQGPPGALAEAPELRPDDFASCLLLHRGDHRLLRPEPPDIRFPVRP